MSLKRPLEAISFPDIPDCSTQFDANLDNSMALSFAFAKYVAVRSFKKCLKEDCTSKIKNTLIDKIYYIRYRNSWDRNYFRIGALDNVSMGYGILLNNYSNTLLYPQVRKVGLEFRSSAFGTNIHGFTNDFKENFGLTALRISAPVP